MRTEDYDPYLNPGHHLPIDIACEDETVRAKLLALDAKYAKTPKVMLFDWVLGSQGPCVGPAPWLAGEGSHHLFSTVRDKHPSNLARPKH